MRAVWSLACHSSFASSSDSNVQLSTERYELMSAGRDAWSGAAMDVCA